MTTSNAVLEKHFGTIIDGIARAAYNLSAGHRGDEVALDALRSLAYALGHTVNAAKKAKRLGEG